MERIDLHLHSNVSDGGLPPAEVREHARAGKLDIIALTDHDTARGVRQLQAHDGGPRLIPGIEISSTLEHADVHMLGYFIDPAHARILAHERYAVDARTERMRAMIARLEALGISVPFEAVQAIAGEGAMLGRPHLARALVDRGYASSVGDAFNRYIGDNGPAYVAAELIAPDQAIELIHEAGGIAVWAHPPLDRFERQIPTFVGWGIDGVEAVRPRMLPREVQTIEGYADMYGLITTGGSDWHGPWNGRLGEFCVTRRQVGAFLERGGL